MIRVVLDANVLVSAAIKSGPSHRILEAAMDGKGVSAVLCPTLLAEVEDVLARPRLRRRLDAASGSAFIDDLVTFIDHAPDPATVPAVTRDPDDDYLVALARRHRLDFIVTGDKDLLEWGEEASLAISPAAFEALLTRDV